MLSNFSKLLSNSLAITKIVSSSSSSAMIESKQIGGRRLLSGGHNDFPKWLSAADRRLLQAVEPASRPWGKYSRTVIIKSDLDGLVDPAGWLPWDENTTILSTVYYGEFMNTGIGADTEGRVKWPGYHVINNAAEAEQFTVENFLDGGSWIPGTGVPFDDGL
ncbi:Pectinesterase [Quillaja saponaria]|uniref:Pectinesterase n=1 Tax=Quillaja saponaria TaxID=32244 RepID=A0AAD7LBE2_QUISA|nr:Pectinesterase [Quillaja saponaria]